MNETIRQASMLTATQTIPMPIQKLSGKSVISSESAGNIQLPPVKKSVWS